MRDFPFYFLLAVGIAVLLSGVAAADSTCSFSYNSAIVSGFTVGYQYLISGGSSSYSTTTFAISNAQYLPTYIYVSPSLTDTNTGLKIYYYPKTSSGCSQYTSTAKSNLGMSGYIQIYEDNVTIGSWTYYKRDTYIAFFASYDVDGIRSGKYQPFGKTIKYIPTSYWQSNEPDCGIQSASITGLSYTLYNPPSDPLTPLITSIQLSGTTYPLIFTAPIKTSTNVTVAATASFLNIRSVNMTVTHDPYSNLFIIDILNGFDGSLNITAVTGQVYSFPFVANKYARLFIPHYSNFMEVVDSKGVKVIGFEIDKELGSCLNPALIGLKSLTLVDQAGNKIPQFSIILNGQEYRTSNGYINVPDLNNQQITVIPLNRPDLQFNVTVTTVSDTTQIVAPLYVYTVQIAVRQQDIMGGLSPVSFRYTITGEEYANKTQMTNPNFSTEGVGYDNVTVFLLPGNYQLNLRTVTVPFAKENSTNLTLFDTRYYRKITWTVGLLGDSFSETTLTSPLLTVLVIDQNSTPVSNAEVQLYDAMENMLAAKITKNDGLAQFSTPSGANYTVKVYYANNLKAVKSFYFPENETTFHLTIPISISKEEISAGQKPTQATPNEAINLLLAVFTNYVFIAFFIILLLAGAVARAGGTEIGIVALIVGIGVFTFVVPVLPVQILALIAVISGVLFGLRIVRR